MPAWLEDATNGLTARFRALLAALYRDLQGLDERVHELDREIAALARENEAVQRIEQLCGIGPLTLQRSWQWSVTGGSSRMADTC